MNTEKINSTEKNPGKISKAVNKIFQSKSFNIGLIIVGALIILLLVFKAGVFIGYKKAQFSYRWGENYHRNFAGPRGGFLGDFKRGFGDGDYINAHGVFGQVIKIDGQNVIVKDRENIEKIILVGGDTVITRFRERVSLADLKAGDYIMAIGEPNEAGQIEAKFVRIFPSSFFATSSPNLFKRGWFW